MKRRRPAPDRRVAVLLFSLTAVVLVVTVGVAAAPSLPRPEPDAGAARELVALMRTGERRSWKVTYEFTRRLADGRALSEIMREARNDELHVLIAGSSMTIERANRSYECTLVKARAGCHESDRAHVLPESEVLRVAVNTHAYGVSRVPDRTIAGEPAHCFRVRPTGPGVLPDIGTETVMCVSDDGIALDERVVRTTGNTDRRVATAVERDVSTEQIRALAQSFDPSATRSPR
jgi:hypothetical protein